MPIYEYKCENGHVFDVMQRMSDDPLSSCVECGAPVRKILQPVGISFKGSGFYSTDYSKKSPRTEPAKNGGPSKESGSDSTDKTSSEKSSSAKTGSSPSGNGASTQKAAKK